jgi:acetyl-CoA acetyltransferase
MPRKPPAQPAWPAESWPPLVLFGKSPAKVSVFVRTRTLTHDGDFPNNTSGGQLSAGQAGCAGGFLGMTEAIRQLTDAAGDRAVPGAELGLVSGFGMVTYDRCLCTGAVILSRSGS